MDEMVTRLSRDDVWTRVGTRNEHRSKAEENLLPTKLVVDCWPTIADLRQKSRQNGGRMRRDIRKALLYIKMADLRQKRSSLGRKSNIKASLERD